MDRRVTAIKTCQGLTVVPPLLVFRNFESKLLSLIFTFLNVFVMTEPDVPESLTIVVEL